MKKSKARSGFDKKIRLSWIIIICLILIVGTALFTRYLILGKYDSRDYLDNAKRYLEIEKAINDNYIGTVTEEELYTAASAGMVRALGDKWSYYMTAEEYNSYRMTGTDQYSGIGMSVIMNSDGGFAIGTVDEGSVAAKAGLIQGQALLAVDGNEVKGLTLAEVQNMIRLKLNTSFSVTVINSEDDEQSVTLDCASVYRSPVSYRLIEENVGYIRIKNFEAGCGADTRAAIDYLISIGASSFVFDLRGNSGGLYEELAVVLDYLLPDGVLFSSVDIDGNKETVKSDKLCLKYKTSVIVDAETYGAAEIFAADIQEYNWGSVVGQQTTGKARTQIAVELSNGDAIHISTGKYLTSKGADISETGGITPNVPSVQDPESEEDTVLQTAVRSIRSMG